MGTAAESVLLDDDVHEELRKLSEISGRPLGVLANAALRDFLRYERSVGSAIDRGVADLDAGRTRTTEGVLAFLEEQRRARSRG
jgi:predicted transcriptional regulator